MGKKKDSPCTGDCGQVDMTIDEYTISELKGEIAELETRNTLMTVALEIYRAQCCSDGHPNGIEFTQVCLLSGQIVDLLLHKATEKYAVELAGLPEFENVPF